MGLSNHLTLKTEPKEEIYYRIMMRLIETKGPIDGSDRDTLKQFCFIGVKYVNAAFWGRNNEKLTTQEHAEAKFTLICMITDLMALLTPDEFMQVFPIEKEYKGHKYQTKDYFTVMDELKSYEVHAPIGEERIMHFLWAYHNWDIVDFEVEKMCTMNDLRRWQGEKGIMEEFMEENGVDTYTYHEDEGYLYNHATGKTIKVSKPKKRVPKQFKVVK